MTGRAIGLLFWPCPGVTAAFCVQLTAVSAGFGHFFDTQLREQPCNVLPLSSLSSFYARTHTQVERSARPSLATVSSVISASVPCDRNL